MEVIGTLSSSINCMCIVVVKVDTSMLQMGTGSMMISFASGDYNNSTFGGRGGLNYYRGLCIVEHPESGIFSEVQRVLLMSVL